MMKRMTIAILFSVLMTGVLGQSVDLNDLPQVKKTVQGSWTLNGVENQISFVKGSYTGGVYQDTAQLAVPIFNLEDNGGATFVWHEASRKSIPWKILELTSTKMVVQEGNKKLTFTR